MQFSIIIPMYNVEKYISDCLNSILIQEFRDFELILVDDGSNDKTLEIAKQIKENADEDINISIYEQKNSGASAARNLGLSVAKGYYIVFMDSDDTMLPGALETMYKEVSTDHDLCVFSLKKKKGNMVLESTLTDIGPFSVKSERSVDVIEEYLKRTGYKITWQPWAKLFKKKIIDDNNIKFDTELHSCNDFNFFFSFFMHANSVKYTNIPTVLYTTERPGSISMTKMMRRVTSNTTAYARFFNNIKAMDPTKTDLLDYGSHLFLCVLDLCGGMDSKNIEEVKLIIDQNKEVYNYSRRYISKLKRCLIKILGLRSGTRFYCYIRTIACNLFKLKKESEL